MDTNFPGRRFHSNEWCVGYARCRDKVVAWLDAEAARCCERADATRGITAGDLRQAALCYSEAAAHLRRALAHPESQEYDADDDNGVGAAIFRGPMSERRARDYAERLDGG
jgi:hypothetical protein